MTNHERIEAHNALIDEAIQKASSLPDANGGGSSEAVINSLTITENGTYNAPSGVDGYNPVTVNVPTESTCDSMVVDGILDRSIVEFTNTTAQTLATYAFYMCRMLNKVDTCATAIENYALGYTGLEVLILRSPTVVTLSGLMAFVGRYHSGWTEGSEYVGTVYVPSSLLQSYRASTNWITLFSYGWDLQPIEGSEYE